MSPDEIMSLTDNPNFIPGIYNYCDRWCERCHMTTRCMLYASTSNEVPIKGTAEHQKLAVARQLESSVQLTIDILNQLALEQGIDLNASGEDDREWERQKQLRSSADNSLLTRLSKKYIDQSRVWLDNSDAIFAAADEEMAKAAVMDLPGRDLDKEIADMKNALDVIFWYKFQIMVKLVRAQTSKMDENDQLALPMDSAASAKVALIGIDHSIVAWGKLLESFPAEEKSILSILSVLVRLRKEAEEIFPEARGFVRPGLD